MTNIGILGGTFNPIHLGHTLPAKAVATHLSLDKVLLIPTNTPPHKSSPNISANQRATMVKLACKDDPILCCDERELTRNGYSYTIDTVKELSQLYPNARLHFIMGLDSLLTFTTWYQYQEILTFCHLVVNTRPNYQLSDINQETKNLLCKHLVNDLSVLEKMKFGGIFLLPHTLPNHNKQVNINLSSTELRERLINKQSCQQLINPNVLDFINKNQLYR